MALISPGVEVQVIDESQYTPTAAGTVAYVLVATAEDKQTPGGTQHHTQLKQQLVNYNLSQVNVT